MRFADLFSSMDLSVYPTLGLVIFAGIFLLVTFRVLRADKRTMNRNAHMALDDEQQTGGER